MHNRVATRLGRRIALPALLIVGPRLGTADGGRFPKGRGITSFAVTRRLILMVTALVSTAAAGLIAPIAQADTSPPSLAGATTTQQIFAGHVDDPYTLAVRAYVWGYPLVNAAQVRLALTNLAARGQPASSSDTERQEAPVGTTGRQALVRRNPPSASEFCFRSIVNSRPASTRTDACSVSAQGGARIVG
jgi:hypothetical protein